MLKATSVLKPIRTYSRTANLCMRTANGHVFKVQTLTFLPRLVAHTYATMSTSASTYKFNHTM